MAKPPRFHYAPILNPPSTNPAGHQKLNRLSQSVGATLHPLDEGGDERIRIPLNVLGASLID
jgi:hypothetical protein